MGQFRLLLKHTNIHNQHFHLHPSPDIQVHTSSPLSLSLSPLSSPTLAAADKCPPRSAKPVRGENGFDSFSEPVRGRDRPPCPVRSGVRTTEPRIRLQCIEQKPWMSNNRSMLLANCNFTLQNLQDFRFLIAWSLAGNF